MVALMCLYFGFSGILLLRGCKKARWVLIRVTYSFWSRNHAYTALHSCDSNCTFITYQNDIHQPSLQACRRMPFAFLLPIMPPSSQRWRSVNAMPPFTMTTLLSAAPHSVGPARAGYMPNQASLNFFYLHHDKLHPRLMITAQIWFQLSYPFCSLLVTKFLNNAHSLVHTSVAALYAAG